MSRFPRFLAIAMLSIAAVAVVGQDLQGQTQPQLAAASWLKALRPGQFVVRDQAIPVELVFIGYKSDQIDKQALTNLLPATYSPLVRYPQFYGLDGRNMGLSYRFQYKFTFKSRTFENAFFSFLKHTGTAGPLTDLQDAYNQQVNNVLDVVGPVLYIDAPKVERYLAGPGGAKQRGYTIFFINWYGRNDFKFHVYTKTDEPDPDTNYNFGIQRPSRKMIAWGGTSSRTWFYDLSAGPESWTDNWNVDDPDLDGDGTVEYRMPPIWEYRVGGYRPAEQLSEDLGLVARFVGIDLLFTTSPLYDPLVTAPDVGGAKVAHVAMLEDDAGSNGLDYIKADFARTEYRRFQPYYSWRVGLTDTNPVDAGAKRALDIFSGNLVANDCWNSFGDTFAQLFCYFSGNLDTYIPAYKSRDYVGEIFSYNTTAANLGEQFGLLGFADDNWVDGTQTHVFTFDAPEYRELGYGFTSTVIHEFGHHIGMSHPHDGYDSELDFDFGPSGGLYFAWSGDESHTVMQYISLTNQFGQFDRDNMYRYETAGYLNWSNAVLGDILANPEAGHVWFVILVADLAAGQSINAFNNWKYLEAAAAARLSYTLLATAAKQIGVSTPTLNAARRSLPASFRREGCRMRHSHD